MDIHIFVENIQGLDRIVCREGQDRNGAALLFNVTDKQAWRSAIQSMQNPSTPQEIVSGLFVRREDTTNIPIAIFTNEADADAFVITKGAATHRKDIEQTVDGFDYKVVTQV